MRRVPTVRFSRRQDDQHRLRRSVAPPLVAVVLCALVASGCDWTTFGFGPDHMRFNYGENTIGVSNVASLVQLFTVNDNFGDNFTEPAVANGLLYTSSGVFDATGNENCSGSPKVCSPLWYVQAGGTSGGVNTATVVNGVLYATFDINNSVLPPVNTPYLYAYDASGNTNCSGTPKVCAPLWTAPLGGSSPTGVVSEPTVAEGKVFVGDNQYLFAFDTAGRDAGTAREPLGRAHCALVPTSGRRGCRFYACGV